MGPLASGVPETGFAARAASAELAAPASQPSLLECYWRGSLEGFGAGLVGPRGGGFEESVPPRPPSSLDSP